MTEMRPDLPVSVKERLLELTRHLPDASRGQFLASAARRLSGLALEYTDALVFAAVGWLLGEILDHVLTVTVPFSDVILCLTGGKLSKVGFVLGTLYGLSRDIQKQQIRRDVARIIGEEIRRALATEHSHD